MENDAQDVSRRRFLQRLSVIGVAGAGGGVLLSACGGGSEQEGEAQASAEINPCDDLSDLSDAEQEQRQQMVETLDYVDETPNEEQYCANCALYTEPAEDEECGGCQLFPGPVYPEGYCTSWAPA